MNDKLKGIIIGGVVLAALGGTLAVMKFTGLDTISEESSSDTASSSSHVDESVQLINSSASDIGQIDVTNEFGGFTYTGVSESGKENSGIAELKGLELKTRTVSDIGEDTAQLTAYKLVESGASELEKYGLAEGSAEAEFDVHFTDGSQRDFLIGVKAPQNRYRYLREKDSNDVYMVQESVIKPFLNRKEDLVDTSLFPSEPSTTDSENVSSFGTLTIDRKDLDYDMVFVDDDGSFAQSSSNMVSAQVMTEPIFAYLDGTRSTEVIYAMYGLTAQSAEKVFPEEADLAEYGLNDPVCTVTFVGDGYDYKLTIGGEYHEENDQGEEQTAVSAYYCTVEGVDGKDCIWKIDATALPFMTVMPNDIITTLMTWNMVTDVREIKLTDESGSTDTFEITTEGEGDDAELAKITCNGAEVDTESFKALYQYILTCPTKDGIYFEEPQGEPFRRIEIVCADGHTDTIELYKDTDRRAIIKLNGRPSYRIRSTWADRLTKNIEAVKTGGEVEEDY